MGISEPLLRTARTRWRAREMERGDQGAGRNARSSKRGANARFGQLAASRVEPGPDSDGEAG